MPSDHAPRPGAAKIVETPTVHGRARGSAQRRGGEAIAVLGARAFYAVIAGLVPAIHAVVSLQVRHEFAAEFERQSGPDDVASLPAGRISGDRVDGRDIGRRGCRSFDGL